MLLTDIDRICCLSLDKRYDSWLRLLKQFANLGIYMQPYICGLGNCLPKSMYHYIDDPTFGPIKNAAMCHQQIIRHAYADGVELLFMLEDDAILTNDFVERLDTINVEDFDILWLGSFTPFTQNVEDCVKTELRDVDCTIGGLHGILIKRSVFTIFDHFNTNHAFDGQIGKYCFKNSTIKAKYLCPSIVIMDIGQSYANTYNAMENDGSGLGRVYHIAKKRNRLDSIAVNKQEEKSL